MDLHCIVSIIDTAQHISREINVKFRGVVFEKCQISRKFRGTYQAIYIPM